MYCVYTKYANMSITTTDKYTLDNKAQHVIDKERLLVSLFFDTTELRQLHDTPFEFFKLFNPDPADTVAHELFEKAPELRGKLPPVWMDSATKRYCAGRSVAFQYAWIAQKDGTARILIKKLHVSKEKVEASPESFVSESPEVFREKYWELRKKRT